MAKKSSDGRIPAGSTSAERVVGASGGRSLRPRSALSCLAAVRSRRAILPVLAVSCAGFLGAAAFAGCGGSDGSHFGNSSSNGTETLGTTKTLADGAVVETLADGAVVPASNANAFGGQTVITCDGGTNGQCTDNSACPNGGSTSIVGTVYDPADVNPVYNVTVYVPGVPVSSFPDLSTLGVQATAAGAAPFCSCDGFYPPIVADAVTDANGQFTITNAPYGTLTLVVQTGKWRMVYGDVTITPCVQNQIPPQTLRLPRNSTEGNIPDIAISTGDADSLECLPLRIGVDAAEYVGGSGTGGHIHIYQGGGNEKGATTATGTVPSFQGLWDSDADFERHDVVLLSCEGAETSNLTAANQQSLVDYTNNGGRAFLSHYHYAWLRTGPFAADDLATWQGSNDVTEAVDPNDRTGFPGDIDTSFNEGQQMATWLGGVGAVTPNAAATAATCPDCAADPGALPIFYARNNVVTLAQPPSQEWIHLDPSVKAAPNATQYFSFDTPIGQGTSAESQPCGRVVYSDLHVSGGPASSVPPNCTGNPPTCYAADYPPAAAAGFGGGAVKVGTVPNGCRGYGDAANAPSRALSPQEKALEFMLFDLSSCLVPVNSVATAPPIR